MDPFALDRFVDAQAGTFAAAMTELEAGMKRSHWMWFVFPQLRGLGASPTARLYGITGRAEAEAYRAHPLLGPRLVAATRAVLAHPDTPLRVILGTPDDLKFRSSMTLFAAVAGDGEPVFAQALATFCAAEPDPRTLALLAQAG